jgi:hypothetical protein|tara:strand:+ start:389 stop:625 length:237 start_codon:yes stop_codon:yes gene_type:complete
MEDKKEDKFFIIKKYKFLKYDNYEIMKSKPFSLTEALRMLLAYDQLNDNKDVSYHLNKVDSFEPYEDPLVLNKDMEVN